MEMLDPIVAIAEDEKTLGEDSSESPRVSS